MKWGILATGNIAKKFASTVLQMKEEGERLLAVGSRNLSSAKNFAEEYGIEYIYGSYEELAASPEVDAVYIATPNNLHYENCRLCLMQGKHVLCEKPFTISPGQAEELYRLAEEKGLFLMEAFWIRFLPLYEELRKILAAGEIGEVRELYVQYGFVAEGARRTRKFRSELGGGALLDIGIYNLGFLRMITDTDPVSFSTRALKLNEFHTDAYSDLDLVYPGEIKARTIQTIGQVLDRNARIEGSEGSIILEDFQHAVHMKLLKGQETIKEYAFPFDINGFEYQIREVTRCAAAGKTGSEIYTPEDSIALSRLLYDIRNSWNMKFDGE